MDVNILTFDLEEWFHCDFISDEETWSNHEVRIYESTNFILNTLSKYDRKATFFVLGWIADKYPEIVKKIHSQGHEIGCHSMKHKLVHRLTPQQFRDDSRNAIDTIEQIIGEKIIMYRAPAFSITEETPWAFEILNELGITHDASLFPAKRDYGGFAGLGKSEPLIIEINGIHMKEFPMNIHEILNKSIVFSGGGFFRLFPYFLIKKWAKDSDYVMSYFHPRDFDKEQPVLTHLPIMRKFKSYYGLKKSGTKFDKYISDFKTSSILDVSEKYNWSIARKHIIK
jgi:polysaccharide deacetylase family protein (PEP-CTERM system associated)